MRETVPEIGKVLASAEMVQNDQIDYKDGRKNVHAPREGTHEADEETKGG